MIALLAICIFLSLSTLVCVCIIYFDVLALHISVEEQQINNLRLFAKMNSILEDIVKREARQLEEASISRLNKPERVVPFDVPTAIYDDSEDWGSYDY